MKLHSSRIAEQTLHYVVAYGRVYTGVSVIQYDDGRIVLDP